MYELGKLGLWFKTFLVKKGKGKNKSNLLDHLLEIHLKHFYNDLIPLRSKVSSL